MILSQNSSNFVSNGVPELSLHHAELPDDAVADDGVGAPDDVEEGDGAVERGVLAVEALLPSGRSADSHVHHIRPLLALRSVVNA